MWSGEGYREPTQALSSNLLISRTHLQPPQQHLDLSELYIAPPRVKQQVGIRHHQQPTRPPPRPFPLPTAAPQQILQHRYHPDVVPVQVPRVRHQVLHFLGAREAEAARPPEDGAAVDCVGGFVWGGGRVMMEGMIRFDGRRGDAWGLVTVIERRDDRQAPMHACIIKRDSQSND